MYSKGQKKDKEKAKEAKCQQLALVVECAGEFFVLPYNFSQTEIMSESITLLHSPTKETRYVHTYHFSKDNLARVGEKAIYKYSPIPKSKITQNKLGPSVSSILTAF